MLGATALIPLLDKGPNLGAPGQLTWATVQRSDFINGQSRLGMSASAKNIGRCANLHTPSLLAYASGARVTAKRNAHKKDCQTYSHAPTEQLVLPAPALCRRVGYVVWQEAPW